MSGRGTVLGYCAISALAAGLLLLAAFLAHGDQGGTSLEERLVVAVAFMASCALGMMMGSRPGWLRRRSGGASTGREDADGGLPGMVAHHPDCGRFGGRAVIILGRERCGGCLGLVIGSALALAIMASYPLWPGLDGGDGLRFMALGMVLVAFSLAEIALDPRAGWLHVAANGMLVISFLLVTVGALESTGEAALGLLAVLICILWLDARIQISDWRHARTCASCGRGCGYY